MPTNVQLKGNSPADPWFVLEGSPQEIAETIIEVFPSLTLTGPEAFPSLVAQARQLWAAQVTAGSALGATEVAVEQTTNQHPAPQSNVVPGPWGQAQSQAAPAQQYQQYQQPVTAGAPGTPPLDPYGRPMKWLSGTSKSSGKPYKGWFADYPKGGMPNGVDIPPIFVR